MWTFPQWREIVYYGALPVVSLIVLIMCLLYKGPDE